MSKSGDAALRSRGEEELIHVPPVADPCEHVALLGPVRPSAAGCEECLQTGDTWVNLRLCMTCGHVGCCDSSVNKHATKHYHATGHPIIKSFQPVEHSLWCYVHEKMMT
jgi:uncharacterized UBP type Zn finger protein